jgi:hypothetical protein
VLPGAVESVACWSPSSSIFLRFLPDTDVVPVVVRGVLWRRAYGHPLTLFRRMREDREMLGAVLQILARTAIRRARPVRVRVDALRAFEAHCLAAGGKEADAAIRECVSCFLPPRARA